MRRDGDALVVCDTLGSPPRRAPSTEGLSPWDPNLPHAHPCASQAVPLVWSCSQPQAWGGVHQCPVLEMGTCRGFGRGGRPLPSAMGCSRASPGSAEGLRGCTFPVCLILRGSRSSVGVSHAELCGLGLPWLGGHRGISPQGITSRMLFAAGQCCEAPGTSRLCRNSLDVPGGNCLKYRATFTSVTQRKLSSSFCRGCSLH